jgi:hypothetical protein
MDQNCTGNRTTDNRRLITDYFYLYKKTLPMLGSLLSKGKNMMYFGGVCIICGFAVFFAYDVFKESNLLILYWFTHYLGRYGFAGFFAGAGVIFIIRGLIQQNFEKKNKPGGDEWQ